MRVLILFAAVVASGAPAMAQGLGDAVSAEGHFALGVSDRVPGADAFLVGTGTARLSFGRFGAELGVYGRADALDTPHETYGTLTYDIGANGRLAVGVPRPAYDGFAQSALELSFPSLGIDRTQSTRSAATHGAMFAGWLPYGASFENETGDLRYSFSVHSSAAPGTTVVGVGIGTTVGPWALSGAIESAGGDVSAKAQVARDFGTARGGLGFYAPAAAGVSDLVEAFASFEPVDRIGVTAVVQVPVDGGSATGGFSARYELTDNAGLSMGVASDAGSDAVYNAFVDFKF